MDISVGEGQGEGFELQVTERSKTVTVPEGVETITVSVQCNSDEIVTGGGFHYDFSRGWSDQFSPLSSEKHDNGWSTSWRASGGSVIEVHAECLKVVNE